MRFLSLLVLFGTSVFTFKSSSAEENLRVAPNIAWLGKPAPKTLRKLLPARTQILKCGVAAFGPQGAMRWVVAWANQGKEEKRDITIGLFSQSKDGFKKRSERSIGQQNVKLHIKLYWLQPSTLNGPVIQLGNESAPGTHFSGTLIAFPQGWKGQVVKQDFYSGNSHNSFHSYQFPLVDDKGFLCVKNSGEDTDPDGGGHPFEAILKWKGKGWSQ